MPSNEDESATGEPSPAGEPQQELVYYLHAFFAWCPYCLNPADAHDGRVFATPDVAEAQKAAELGVPDPAIYAEPIPAGGGNDVFFLSCPKCAARFVARLVPKRKDLESYRKWEVLKKHQPWRKHDAPKIDYVFEGATFETWMLEVLANPNGFVRQKAMREAAKHGLPPEAWQAVAATAGAQLSA